MPVLEHDRVREGSPSAEELERLWTAPAAAASRLAARRAEPPGRALSWIWGIYLVSILFAPAPVDEAVAVPWWAYALAALLFIGLVTAAVAAILGSGAAAFGASAFAGGAALALAVGCVATAHHAPAWWAYELVASAAVLGLSGVCLARARRRS